MTDFFRKLFGGGDPTTVTLAPPVSNYPSADDAAYARQYGFGYGDPAESYIQGNTARLVGQPRGNYPFVPRSVVGMSIDDAAGMAANDKRSQNLDLNDPANAAAKQSIGDTLTRAALAVNRMPVAALGFDPSRAAFDTVLKDMNVAGAYSPKTDTMYANTNERDPSTVVHESAHRGIAQLRKDPALAGIFNDLPGEETVVRYLMAKQAGDPEKNTGAAGVAEREFALKMLGSGHYNSSLEKLDKAAQDAIAKRRPGGPR